MVYRNLVCDLFLSFKDICEYRSRKPEYAASILLAVIVIGLLSGENTIKNIENYIKNNPDRVKEYLKNAGMHIKNIPSDSTALRALHEIDYLDLLAIVSEWSSRNFTKSNHIAIDGKALRACLKKCFGGTHPPYIVNAFNVESSSIHAQIQVGNKTNELGEFEDLLGHMNLDGACITADAAFSTSSTMRKVIAANGHMIMALKGNLPNLEEAIHAFIDEARIDTDNVHYFEDADNGLYLHGRICNRNYSLISVGVDELLQGTDFEGLAHSVGMVERYREVVLFDADGNRIKQDIETQVAYYLLDRADISVEEFARLVRSHWAGSEIVHYILDVEFDEDMSRIRTGNGMQNLSLLRKVVVSILAEIKRKAKTLSFHDLRQDIRDLGGIAIDHVKADQGNTAGTPAADAG